MIKNASCFLKGTSCLCAMVIASYAASAEAQTPADLSVYADRSIIPEGTTASILIEAVSSNQDSFPVTVQMINSLQSIAEAVTAAASE